MARIDPLNSFYLEFERSKGRSEKKKEEKKERKKEKKNPKKEAMGGEGEKSGEK